jgi:hypothetical protein
MRMYAPRMQPQRNNTEYQARTTDQCTRADVDRYPMEGGWLACRRLRITTATFPAGRGVGQARKRLLKGSAALALNAVHPTESRMRFARLGLSPKRALLFGEERR